MLNIAVTLKYQNSLHCSNHVTNRRMMMLAAHAYNAESLCGPQVILRRRRFFDYSVDAENLWT